MRHAAIILSLVFFGCGGDTDSVHVQRAWSDGHTAHYDLSIDGVERHVARTPRSVGATVLVSDAAGDVAGAAQHEDETAYVLASEPETLATEMPETIDTASAYALELALAGDLPEVEVARLDDLPPYMPTTCEGRCDLDRQACFLGETNLVIIALCDWWYRQCVDMCHPIGGSGGVWN